MTQPLPRPRKLQARVLSKDRVSHDVVRLRLLPEDENFDHLPGQYLRLYLGGFEPRDYSIASQPQETGLEFHIRDQGEGGASSYAAQTLAVGDSLLIEGPFGHCTLDQAHGGPLIGVAGGTGLAPVLAILRQALEAGHQEAVQLCYGARRKADHYLSSDIRKLEQRFDNFTFFFALTDEETERSRKGLVTDLLTPDLLLLEGARFYVAGPPAMVEAAVARLRSLGLPEDRIHADAFTLGPALPQESDR